MSKYIKWDVFPEISAITTTKDIGNMAYHVSSDSQLVRLRRGKVCSYLGIDNNRLIFTHQTHSDKIAEVTYIDIGKGSLDFESGVDADALYTLEKGLAIGIFHADCVPIFVYAPSIHLVGIVHAGYEGTLKHIAYKFIDLMKKKYQLAGSDIYCHIGPCRQFFSFHINKTEKDKIIASHAEKALRFNGEDDALFDMPFANIVDLVDAGVPMANITSCLIDTTDEPNCFSAYVQEKNDGRMASIIMLNE